MVLIKGPLKLLTKKLNTHDSSLLSIELDSNTFVILCNHKEIGT